MNKSMCYNLNGLCEDDKCMCHSEVLQTVEMKNGEVVSKEKYHHIRETIEKFSPVNDSIMKKVIWGDEKNEELINEAKRLTQNHD